MCFTVNVNLIKEELESRYGATLIDPDKYRPSYYYHAFSLPELPAVCCETPKQLRLLRWGLIPSWIKTSAEADKIRFKTFNARSETIDSKPSYSSSLSTRRCIIPVKGFFEWQHIGKEKLPWYICHYNNEILSLAGLYENWTSDITGEVITTFSIITTTANELLAEIHNTGKRMPAILDKNDEQYWLDSSIVPDEVLKLLKPSPAGILKAHTVCPLINDKAANKNSPEVIKPFSYHSGNLLF